MMWGRLRGGRGSSPDGCTFPRDIIIDPGKECRNLRKGGSWQIHPTKSAAMRHTVVRASGFKPA